MRINIWDGLLFIFFLVPGLVLLFFGVLCSGWNEGDASNATCVISGLVGVYNSFHDVLLILSFTGGALILVGVSAVAYVGSTVTKIIAITQRGFSVIAANKLGAFIWLFTTLGIIFYVAPLFNFSTGGLF